MYFSVCNVLRISRASSYTFPINLDSINAVDINFGQKLSFCSLCNVVFLSTFRRIGHSSDVVESCHCSCSATVTHTLRALNKIILIDDHKTFAGWITGVIHLLHMREHIQWFCMRSFTSSCAKNASQTRSNKNDLVLTDATIQMNCSVIFLQQQS